MNKTFFFLLSSLISFNSFAQCPTVSLTDKESCLQDITTALNPVITGNPTIMWTSSGTGQFFPSNTSPVATYSKSLADEAGVKIALTTTNNGGCPISTDTMNITYIQTPYVGLGAIAPEVCVTATTINLSGEVGYNTTFGWTTTGTGSINPNTQTLNSVYTISPQDKLNGTVRFTLSAANDACSRSDYIDVKITDPKLNAGSDQFICSNKKAVLAGTANNYTFYNWTTSGTGTFNNVYVLNATYTPSAADTAAGSVTLTLNPMGWCMSATDQMILSFSKAPIVNAGLDQNVCGTSSISLNGKIYNATNATWTSSGTGIFFPNANTLNATYQASSQDSSNGIVTLTLASVAGICTPISDNLVIRIYPLPIANAGLDKTVCKEDPSVSLIGGSVKNANTFNWSGGGGSHSLSSNLTSATYTPTAAEKLSGSVELTLIVTSAQCPTPSEDRIIIYFTNSPVVDAGSEQIICSSTSANISLDGSVQNALSTTWYKKVGASEVFYSYAMDTTYKITPADSLLGNVEFILKASQGQCKREDKTRIDLLRMPVANAGPDLYLNAGGIIVMPGGVSFYESVLWSTSGTGTFLTPTSPYPDYYPSASDMATGNIIIVMTVTNVCGSAKDTAILKKVRYSLAGQVFAGANSLDAGSVSLFKITNQSYDLIAMKVIQNSSSAFQFTSIEEGEYVLYAAPAATSIYTSSYLPTYHLDAQEWPQATPIILNANATQKNIQLISYIPTNAIWNSGQDSIYGNVSLQANALFSNNQRLASQVSLEQGIVYLLDGQDQLLTYHKLGVSGNFTFRNLIAGKYKIKVQYPGVTDNFTIVNIDGDPFTQDIQSIEVLPQDQVTGLNSGINDYLAISIFPNPSSNNVMIQALEVNGVGSIIIRDCLGKSIYQAEKVDLVNGVGVSISEWPSALYFVEIRLNKKVYNGKFYKN